MAFGMKHWMGLTTVGLLLVSIWKLPPSAMEPRDRGLTLPEVRRAEALSDDIERTHRALMHLRWSDSLSAMTVETSVDGVAVAFPENTPDNHLPEPAPGAARRTSVELSEEAKEELRQSVLDEVAALTPRADVDFGFFFQRLDHGAADRTRIRIEGQTTYLGVRDGQAFCLHVYAVPDMVDGNLRRSARPDGRANATGTCRPYLKYGLPGRHVGEWMGAGASDFAMAPSPPEDPSFNSYRPARRTFFGLNTFGFRTQSVEVDRCMAGIVDGCLTAVTDPRVFAVREEMRQTTPGVTRLSGSRNWWSPFRDRDDYLLGDLEAEFGPERFQRFWSSPEEVPDAFRAAFGMEMGAWVLTWVERNMDVSPPGPGLTRSAALGGLLAVSLMAALGGAWARRRRVN